MQTQVFCVGLASKHGHSLVKLLPHTPGIMMSAHWLTGGILCHLATFPGLLHLFYWLT